MTTPRRSPIAYLGAVGLTIPSPGTIPGLGIEIPGLSIPAFGVAGLYLAFVAETAIPAVINYYRFLTGRWKAISRGYRPETTPSDD